MVYSHEAMRREHEAILRDARHVRIDAERVQAVARVMREQLARGQDATADPTQSPAAVLRENNLDTLQFYLILTSQEFLIWRRLESGQVAAWEVEVEGRPYVGAPGIAACHVRALRQDRALLDPTFLASMTLGDVREFYRDERAGETTLQMLPQRVAKFNEIGRVLLERYDGHVANLLKETEGYLFRDDGRGLIQQLCLHFPTAYFDWPFCKLAFLLAMFWSVRNRENIPTTEEYRALTEIRDPEHFEVPADYYIPLFFIRTGIFRIGDELGGRLARQQLIERNSQMEHEFRAGTMVAGRMLAEATGYSVAEVDHECWKMGYRHCRLCRVGISDEELPCAYRELSVAYQDEHHLMEMRWPLVLTTSY
jgi:hypothetical protein